MSIDLTGFPVLSNYVRKQKIIVEKADVGGMKYFEIRRLEWEYPHVSKKIPEEGDLGINRRRKVFCFLGGKWKSWAL